MDAVVPLRCRVAACPESRDDGKEWSFYLVNDTSLPFDRVVLKTFGHEWGEMGSATHPNVQVRDLAPGASTLIWRDNDEEMRMWLTVLVKAGNREAELMIEFPLLYRRKDSLRLVADIGKCGWEAVAEANPPR